MAFKMKNPNMGKTARAAGMSDSRGGSSALPKRDIPTASELDKMESQGRYITKANPDSDKAPEKDSEGNTKMYLAAGLDDMTKLTDSEGNMYIDTKAGHTVTDEKNPEKRTVASEKQGGEGGKPSNLTRYANQKTREKYDPETGKKITKAKTEGGSALPRTEDDDKDKSKSKKPRKATPDDIIKRSKSQQFEKDYYVNVGGRRTSVKRNPDTGSYTYKGDYVDPKNVKEGVKRKSPRQLVEEAKKREAGESAAPRKKY